MYYHTISLICQSYKAKVPSCPQSRLARPSPIYEEGSKDTPNTVNVRYCTYSACFTHLHKGRKTSFYTQNFSFVTVLTKFFDIWFRRDMWWRQLRVTEKCFLEADWLKTTGVISSVPVLPCPSSPRPPLYIAQLVNSQPIVMTFHKHDFLVVWRLPCKFH